MLKACFECKFCGKCFMSRTTSYACRHTAELLPTTVSMRRELKDRPARHFCAVCLVGFNGNEILAHVR